MRPLLLLIVYMAFTISLCPAAVHSRSDRNLRQRNTILAAAGSSSPLKPFAQGGSWSGLDPESFDNVWISAYLACTVYKNDSETDVGFKARFCNHMKDTDGAKNCTWWSGDQGGQNVAVLETADSFIFVFRGSQDQKDFITDVKSQAQLRNSFTETIQYFGGKGTSVPEGFFTSFKLMWNAFLKDQVNYIKDRIKAKTGPSNIFVTGHSLGAVMTQYLAAAAQNAGLNISGVYPFASPNTGGKDAWWYGHGDQSWPKRYEELGLESKTWLFNNPSDVVPSIPTVSWTQVGSPVFNPVNKNPKMCPFAGRIPPSTQTRSDKATRNFIMSALKHTAKQTMWDHNIDRYVWQLGKTCANDTFGTLFGRLGVPPKCWSLNK